MRNHLFWKNCREKALTVVETASVSERPTNVNEAAHFKCSSTTPTPTGLVEGRKAIESSDHHLILPEGADRRSRLGPGATCLAVMSSTRMKPLPPWSAISIQDTPIAPT